MREQGFRTGFQHEKIEPVSFGCRLDLRLQL